MKKLTLDDIRIKSRGIQLKEVIKDRYGTMKNFADSIDEFGYGTIKQYLNSSKLGSDEFKNFLTEELGQGYEKLVLSEYKQLETMVDEVLYNTHRYSNPEDVDILEKLEQLCIKKNYRIGIMKMKRNFAKHYFEGNRIKQAMMYIKEAIELAENSLDKEAVNYRIYFKCEYALMYYHQSDFKTAMKVLKKIYIEEVEEDEFKDKARFKYFYSYGTLLSDGKKKYKEAKEYFEKAVEYSYDSVTKGGAISAIGLTYLRKNEYSDAIITFKKALEIQENKHRKGIIHTNLAIAHQKIAKFEDAIQYIEKALELIDKNRANDYFYAYKIYIRVKGFDRKRYESIIELFQLIKNYEDKFVPKSFIIEGFVTLIELSSTYGYFDILKEVKEYLMYLINIYEEDSQYNKEYIERLYACIGRAYKCYAEK